MVFSAEKVQEIVEEKEAEYKKLEEEYSFLKEEYRELEEVCQDLKKKTILLKERAKVMKKQTKLYCASIMKTSKRWMIFRNSTINLLKAVKRLTEISLFSQQLMLLH